MPVPSERTLAYRSRVIFNLGPGDEAGGGARFSPRSLIPTLTDLGPVRTLASRLGLRIGGWLYNDRQATALELCQGRWRPAIAALAFDPRGGVPSVDSSADRFAEIVEPLGFAVGTRCKYEAHRRSVLTWAIWKGVLHELLPMSERLLKAYLWDALAFDAPLSVLKHALGAIKAWHRKLGFESPADGPGDFRRLTTSLARFQPTPRSLKFPLHAEAVRRLLLLPLPEHPKCRGVIPPKPKGCWARCPICWAFLHRWVDCLAAVIATLTCCRCKEAGLLQVCDVWWRFDERAGFLPFVGGAAFNIAFRKNDQQRKGHQPRVGVPKDPRFDVLAQLAEVIRLLQTTPRPGCTKHADPSVPCPACPPLFPRRHKKGQEFDLSRQATSTEMSAMIVRGLGHVGFDTSLFSGISARKGGLSTAIEAGVPEVILWMQSGHAQDVAARRYVQLQSPALMYATYESFNL